MFIIVVIFFATGFLGTTISQALMNDCFLKIRVYSEYSRTKTAKAQIKDFETALELYKMEKGKYPSTNQGLEILTKDRKSGEPYMRSIPKDPWGNEYQYQKIQRKFEIISNRVKYSELGKED